MHRIDLLIVVIDPGWISGVEGLSLRDRLLDQLRWYLRLCLLLTYRVNLPFLVIKIELDNGAKTAWETNKT